MNAECRKKNLTLDIPRKRERTIIQPFEEEQHIEAIPQEANHIKILSLTTFNSGTRKLVKKAKGCSVFRH